MGFSLAQILLFIIAYLTGLFLVAHLADKGIIPQRITHHPAVYVLSLGVYAGAMGSNGVIAFAHQYGYNYLLYYQGVVLVFVLAALLLKPLHRLCRDYQLASLADVLAFRFRSPWVGAAVTVAMCVTLLPLLALQIQAVADSIHILAGAGADEFSARDPHNRLALLFCIIITVFSILFGTRHVSSQFRNTGLVTAIAFESLVKLSALTILFLAAIYPVFGGFSGLEQWIDENPAVSQSLTQLVQGDDARALLLIFFAGAVCMPHIFHMTFAESTTGRDLRTATWGLPLYLLLISLPILPLAAAGMKLGFNMPMDYSGLAIGIALHSIPISAFAFV
ncbi:MAG TPA: histidine kinase, partial [Halioglobus sp.]